MKTPLQRRADEQLLRTRMAATNDRNSRLVVDAESGPGCACPNLQPARSDRPADATRREIF